MVLRSLARLALLGVLATLAVTVCPAVALSQGAVENATPLEQAREESGIEDRPQNRFELPGGALRLSASELLAANRQQLELSVTLDRAVDDATFELTLPARWLRRRISRASARPAASNAGPTMCRRAP